MHTHQIYHIPHAYTQGTHTTYAQTGIAHIHNNTTPNCTLWAHTSKQIHTRYIYICQKHYTHYKYIHTSHIHHTQQTHDILHIPQTPQVNSTQANITHTCLFLSGETQAVTPLRAAPKQRRTHLFPSQPCASQPHTSLQGPQGKPRSPSKASRSCGPLDHQPGSAGRCFRTLILGLHALVSAA